MMRIGLISDTHGKLRREVFDLFADVDIILHAGDVGPPSIVTELESIAPVHAVLGNTDSWELRPRVREMVELELEGFRILVIHGHQLGSPTADRLRAAYPRADIIVYGHTHRQRVDRVDGMMVVNPGAAGAARFELKPSVGILTLSAGGEPSVEIIEIGG
jgi:uncharacterized protein